MTENEVKSILEEVKMLDDSIYQYNRGYLNALEIAIKSLEEIQQYRAIGTVEECREARERQEAKKPVMKPLYEDMEEEYLCCPTCGDILTDRIPMENKDFYFHCLNCGQAFLWERDDKQEYAERVKEKNLFEQEMDRPIKTLAELATQFCCLTECENCPVMIYKYKKRTKRQKENLHIPCCYNLYKWIVNESKNKDDLT